MAGVDITASHVDVSGIAIVSTRSGVEISGGDTVTLSDIQVAEAGTSVHVDLFESYLEAES